MPNFAYFPNSSLLKYEFKEGQTIKLPLILQKELKSLMGNMQMIISANHKFLVGGIFSQKASKIIS
jgi:hypothetical protein